MSGYTQGLSAEIAAERRAQEEAGERPRQRSNHTVTDFEDGMRVVYTPQYGPREDGIVTSVGEHMVFVRYKATQTYGTATYPRDLFMIGELG